MILTREQVDALSWYPEKWKPGDLANLRDTARAYHTLRDGVTGLCDAPHQDVLGDLWTIHDEVGDNEMGWHDEALAIAGPLLAALRAVVARVEES